GDFNSQKTSDSTTEKDFVLFAPKGDPINVESSSSTAPIKVLEWLNYADVGIIEIQGDLGMGSTWTTKCVMDSALKSDLFDEVIWVDVATKHCNRSNMMMQIADHLNFISTNKKKRKQVQKSEKLLKLLKQKIFWFLSDKRFLLILHDMRMFFSSDLAKLGVPHPDIQNKSKVLFTGREYLLYNEPAHRVLSLVRLTFDQAWSLFSERTETFYVSPADIRSLAETLVKSCDRGPLEIILLAGALRHPKKSKKDIALVIEQLRQVIDLRKTLPFKNVCYDMLPSLKLKDCFLYCTHYVEYDHVSVKGLITSWMLEGFLNGFDSLKEAYDEGERILGVLEYRYLLSRSKDRKYVMIDESLRDRYHYILNKGSDEIFTKPELFINDRYITFVDESLTYSENRVAITTLLLYGNADSSPCNIPWNFFYKMWSLEAVIILHAGIKALPRSFADLGELRVLVLRGCLSLVDLDNIKSVQRLEVLCISASPTLNKIPSFFDMHNLKTLNLSYTNIEELHYSLSGLWRLEFLILRGCSKLRKLPRLNKLGSLIVLDLANCISFTGIEDECFGYKPDLHTLDLSRTQVAELPFLLQCINLHRLLLTDCLHLKTLPNLESHIFLSVRDISGSSALCTDSNEVYSGHCVDHNDQVKDYQPLPSTSRLSQRGQSSAPVGLKSYMIKARDLEIQGADNSDWWKWKTRSYEFEEVAELLEAENLVVQGRMDTRKLSPKTKYGAYIVYQLTSNATGFNVTVDPRVELTIKLKKKTVSTTHVHLDPKSKLNPPPRQRGGGWMEIEMGSFFNSQGEDGDVLAILKEVTHNHEKSGLVIQGIEIRPKKSR
ncbi:hypothetical protein GIB67_003009, partial [Kingdonia uniflora]